MKAIAGARKKAGLATAALAIAVPGVIALRSAAAPDLPTHVVARGRFRNEVLAFGLLRAVRSTPVTVPPHLQRPMRIAWLAPAGPVRKGDTVIVFDPTEIEKEFADGRSDRAAADSKRRKAVAEGRQSAAALGLDRTLAQDELRLAEDVAPADEQIFSRQQIVEGRIDRDLLRRRVETSEAKRTLTDRLAGAERALADIEGKKADLRVSQAQRSLESLKVTAPHDGILVYPLSWRGTGVAVGDTVWPSQPIAELPDLSALEARVYVLEGDAGGLAVGQNAKVEIEGRPGAVFEGRVSRVDTLATTRDRQSPVKYFETTVAFEGASSAAGKPGQRVRATILVDDAEDVIAIPRGALFEKDGRRLVYRREGRVFRPVEVTPGRRSLARIVIEKGLRPGDRIALQDPERRQPAESSSPAPGSAAGPASR